MKTVFGIILLLLIFLLLTGCSDEGQPIDIDTDMAEQRGNANFNIELFEVADQLVSGSYLGKTRESLGIPTDNLFMEGEKTVGFDQVSFLGIDGSMTMLLENDLVNSCTFSTDACKEKSTLRANLDEVNKFIADSLNLQKNEFDFICNDKTIDEYDALFSGKGVLKTVYEVDRRSVAVNVIGSGNEAAISIVIQSK